MGREQEFVRFAPRPSFEGNAKTGGSTSGVMAAYSLTREREIGLLPGEQPVEAALARRVDCAPIATFSRLRCYGLKGCLGVLDGDGR